MAANDTPSTDEGGDFISQTEVRTDNEPLQRADCHLELVIYRQQKRNDREKHRLGEETTPFKQASRRIRIQLQQYESPPARRLRSASIGKGRRRLTRTSSMTPAGRVMIR